MPFYCLPVSAPLPSKQSTRLIDGMVDGKTVMIVAAVGLVNEVTALLFARGSKGDLNVKGAILHMAAEAAVSAAPSMMR